MQPSVVEQTSGLEMLSPLQRDIRILTSYYFNQRSVAPSGRHGTKQSLLNAHTIEKPVIEIEKEGTDQAHQKGPPSGLRRQHRAYSMHSSDQEEDERDDGEVVEIDAVVATKGSEQIMRQRVHYT